MDKLVYKLTPEEKEYVLAKAKERNEHKVVGTSRRYDPRRTDLDLHVFGMEGEFAFSKITGLPHMFDTLSLKGDDGYDFILDNGLTIDVKHRCERDRDFALENDSLSSFKADIGVLMWPGHEPNSFEFVGWTSRVHFALQCERHRLLDWRLLVPWQKMRNPKELLAMIDYFTAEKVV